MTAERAGRLFRMINLLGGGGQSRAALLQSLTIDVRGFYRDLEVLRDLGVPLSITEHRYVLGESLDAALARLPFPDPGLNLVEAMQLADGSTAAHRKLKAAIEAFIGKKYRKPTARKKN